MTKDVTLRELQNQWHGSLRSYLIGFAISIILTGAAYFLVFKQFLQGSGLIFLVVGLGFVQAVAQLLFFLHVGKESRPHWKTLIFLFMVLVLLIITIGSLWIMYNLNTRMMPEMTTH